MLKHSFESVVFLSGYDLSKQEGFDRMITDLGNEIGFKYLMAMHLNDSKGSVRNKISKCNFRLIFICKPCQVKQDAA